MQIGTNSPQQLCGLITDSEVRNNCEKVWHEKVFVPVMSNLDQHGVSLQDTKTFPNC